MSTDSTLEKMIARLTEDGALFGKGSAYADLQAICHELDARRLRALDERNKARAALKEAFAFMQRNLGVNGAFAQPKDLEMFRRVQAALGVVT